MDPRPLKRPRSSTPTKGDAVQKKKGSKKSKNKKKVQLPEATSATTKTKQNASPLDETATAEGQMMSQMLSTFSFIEQSRFEAYKRAKLNHPAVEDWVAACVSHHMSLEGPGRPLSDLVTPGSHREIAMVVATAAKIYAQRLVAAALKAERPGAPLSPETLWKVLQERRRNGTDPGFYLQKNGSIQLNAPHSCKNYEQRRLAGLAAQEAYDAKFGTDSSEHADECATVKNEASDAVEERRSDEKEDTKAADVENEVKDEDFMDGADN
ncbi:hypothetical protein FisN_17Lh267 [Fistulifera solaris]|uniref:Uncharacterized protein n=1 Tax=Fistulifera solaris TaxID=1519565 RepID=A0A1Z5KM03_FISSO|nr:hypothetical protein FisN_17Lh267 [Fistulifera solaris]|eukprot:GAX27350.1 hypothetical protein FisN_17Lh267 [Fistulifera solaris]